MASVPRSDKILAQLAQRSGMTRDGEMWLKQALDPFHDTMITPTGYPDTTGSASIVQPIKQSFQINAPTGITTAQTWDCNIINLPWLNSLPMSLTTNGVGTSNNILRQTNPTTIANIGGIQEISGITGTNLQPGLANDGVNTKNISHPIPSLYLTGVSRVVGLAMEVCNTTSDLNKQGLVTVYRVPVPLNSSGCTANTSTFNTGDTVSFTGATSAVWMSAAPGNIAGAQLYAGTKAWDAEKGCYNVSVLNTPTLPAVGDNFTQPVLYNSSQTDATVITSTFSRTNGQVTPFGFAAVPSVVWTEFDMSGALFTGLSSSTSLTVNYIVYLERFPTLDDLDLIVSARRSPGYDIKALEAYSIISQSLPVAVPFDENGLGDWFRSAVNTASEWISPVIKMIPHPTAQMIGRGIDAVKTVSDSFDQPPSNTSVSDKYVPERKKVNAHPRAKSSKVTKKQKK